MGGIISYDNGVKERLLGVSSQTLEKYGAVSAEVAEQMAVGVRRQLATDWGISITGIAGPGGGSLQKPVGLVFIGVANQTNTWHLECRFGHRKHRTWIRLMSCNTALDMLRRALSGTHKTV
jgi:nicotinamide-nucleotide amidase